MKILLLETSSKNCSVAISDGESLLCLCEEVSAHYKQSENLHTFVKWALEGAEIELQEIDAVCLGMGPGSYTGLRIGAAAAKGFCFGLDKPLIAINSLNSMVVPFVNTGYDLIIPMIDARRMEVYNMIFDGTTGAIIRPTQAEILDEKSFQDDQDKKILFIGDGSEKAQGILHLPKADYNKEVYPSAKYLIQEAFEKYQRQEFEDTAYFEPFYLKEFQGVKKQP